MLCHPSTMLCHALPPVYHALPHASCSCCAPLLHAVSSVRTFNSKTPEWGWKEFMERSKLFALDNGFVVNGKLMISVNVTVEEDNAAPALTPGGFSVGEEVVWGGSDRCSDDGAGCVEKGFRGTVLGSASDRLVVRFWTVRGSGQPADERIVVDYAGWFVRPGSCPEEDVYEASGLLVDAKLVDQSHVLVTGTSESDGWHASLYHGHFVRNCSMSEDVKRVYCGRCTFVNKETGVSIYFHVNVRQPGARYSWLMQEGGSLELVMSGSGYPGSTAPTPVDIANWIFVKRDSASRPATHLQVTTVQRIAVANNATLTTAGRATMFLLAGSMPYDLYARLLGTYTRLDWSPLSNERYVYAHMSSLSLLTLSAAFSRARGEAPLSEAPLRALSALPAADASGYWMWSAAATGGSRKSCWYVGPRALIGSRTGLCASTCRTLGCAPGCLGIPSPLHTR